MRLPSRAEVCIMAWLLAFAAVVVIAGSLIGPLRDAESRLDRQIFTDEIAVQKLQARVDRLEKLQGHPFIRIVGSEKESAQPDLNAALGHALMAVQDIFGHDAVINHFRDMTGNIVAKRFPIDAGGLIKAKCEDDAEQQINSLLKQ